ncbi:MAG TPA: large conductance mechanosensitive channel protein MscL [Micromonosporaceae bacterium]
MPYRPEVCAVFKGFKEFITRGNVIDLAVAVVLGGAFAALINQLTKSFLEPLVRVILGGKGAAGTFTIRNQVFDYGAFINAVITFLITAAAIYYLVVLPMNKMIERRNARLGLPPKDETSDEVRLLTEIRDALNRR